MIGKTIHIRLNTFYATTKILHHVSWVLQATDSFNHILLPGRGVCNYVRRECPASVNAQKTRCWGRSLEYGIFNVQITSPTCSNFGSQLTSGQMKNTIYFLNIFYVFKNLSLYLFWIISLKLFFN